MKERKARRNEKGQTKLEKNNVNLSVINKNEPNRLMENELKIRLYKHFLSEHMERLEEGGICE